jgi:tetratricopeptide (TPR) repeat protein
MSLSLLFKVILFSSFLLVISGCNSELKKAQTAYQKGLYINAAESTIQAYQQSPKKTQAFLSDKGAELLTRLKRQGDILMQNPTQDKAILYYKTLGTLLKELKQLGADIPGLDPSIEEVSKKEKQALEVYLDQHYRLGEKALSAKNYRESVIHFQAIQRFQPQYKNTAALLNEASKKAFKTVIVSAFKHRDGTQVVPLKFETIVVDDTLTLSLMNRLTTKKSNFVSFSLNTQETPPPSSNWIIEGNIKASEEWIPGFVDSEKRLDVLEFSYKKGALVMTEKSTFSYTVYRKHYTIKIELLIRLTPQDRPELARNIFVEEELEDIKSYRDQSRDIPQNAQTILYPVAYSSLPDLEPDLNKEYVIKRAIDLAAEKAASQILEVIER